ncbi:vitelline membrane protein 15a-1-like [Anopheles nili]|uniref:vitelline membrane protein 15a-1-like n=1 Tax=Anopheles nili TaxID=185578 RepID=UPI00237A96F2|nr:vitelline membrane protein 15a-1-like [Anopheles nili]
MQSFTVVAILLCVCALGCSAQYGGYAPHPKPAAYHHAPAAPAMHHGHHGYGKGGHVPCGANLLVSCAPHVAHVPCVPAHGGHHQQHYGGHHQPQHHGGYRAFEQGESESEQ